jgi:hypothetical protein
LWESVGRLDGWMARWIEGVLRVEGEMMVAVDQLEKRHGMRKSHDLPFCLLHCTALALGSCMVGKLILHVEMLSVLVGDECIDTIP